MSSFVDSLDGESKEELKDVLAHPGIKHIVDWILWQKEAVPLLALQNTFSFEEVMEHKGLYQGYRNVAKFMHDAQQFLVNFENDE